MGEFERFPWVEPAAGETVCGCGHTPHHAITEVAPDMRNQWQWFELSKPLHISGPFESLTTRWIVCCASCFRSAGADVLKVEIREHWQLEEEGPIDHGAVLRTMGDPEEIRKYLDKLDDLELQRLSVGRVVH